MAQEWNPDRLRSPLFRVLEPVLARLSWPPGRWPTLDDYQQLLDTLPQAPHTGSGARLRVVPQAGAAADWQVGYEPRIYLSGELQTRAENWHDLFNLLAWASFPRTKAALNQRHYQLQRARAASGQTKQPRSPAQDALTQFDESGVIIACSDPALTGLLRDFLWKELFWRRRATLASTMTCDLFGHGLMEKALAPYRGMTGKGLLVPVPAGFFQLPMAERVAMLDRAVAETVRDGARLSRPADLAPVPVLGFPGFTPENETESYYDDRAYFRPGRRRVAG
jgi:hypothetical protein